MTNYHMYIDGFYQFSVEASTPNEAIKVFRRVYAQLGYSQKVDRKRIEAKKGTD